MNRHIQSPLGYGLFSCRGQAAVPALALAGIALACALFGYFITVSPAKLPLVLITALPVFIIAFFRMDIALFILIIAMLFSPEIAVASLPRRDLAISIEDILLVVMGLAWLAKTAIRKEEIIPRSPLNGLIGVYCVCFMISTMMAIITTGINPIKAAFYVLKYMEYFILFYLVLGTIKNQRQVRIFLGALLITFLCVNIYALAQIHSGARLSAPFEGEHGEPNTLGGYQVLMFSICLGIFCHATTRKSAILSGGLALFTILPFLYTLSRSSYLAIVPAYLALIVYARSKRKGLLVILLIVAAVGLAFFTPQKAKDRFYYTFKPQYQYGIPTVDIMGLKLDPSTSARWQDWQRALRDWEQAPFFGYGLTGHSFLDSQYINNLVELGGFGFLAFAFLIWALQRHTRRIYYESEDPLVRGVALGFLAGNIGMLVHAITANTFILIRIMEPYWFLAAMIVTFPRIYPLADSEGNDGPASVRGTGARRNVQWLLRGLGRGGDGTKSVDAT